MIGLEFKKIYIEGTPEVIGTILSIARDKLGNGVNVINLEPILQELE